ncbi:hypothetical protein P20429_2452 [Pseudoalteromonas sp. BSi20429]|nr:hypothetical protein P20429_2452 [Pseudoalteromonas sp. BSi20429]
MPFQTTARFNSVICHTKSSYKWLPYTYFSSQKCTKTHPIHAKNDAIRSIKELKNTH